MHAPWRCALRLHGLSLVDPLPLVSLDGSTPTLAPETTLDAFADACRGAGLTLIEGAVAGWGKRDLARWLTESYAHVSVRLGGPTRVGFSIIPPGLSIPPPPPVDMGPSSQPPSSLRTGAVEELLDLVRVAVSSALGELARGETTAVTDAIRGQSIVQATHPVHGLVWVPADRPRLRLEARVVSLFVADFLARGKAYETDLSVCGACDSVSFDGAGRSCAVCNDREHPSHVRATGGARNVEPFERVG